MSWALEWLELEDGADARSIKRAYAAKLRVTRPDTDPAGFQRLHEAYRAALDACREAALPGDAAPGSSPSSAMAEALQANAVWLAADVKPWPDTDIAIEGAMGDAFDPTGTPGEVQTSLDAGVDIDECRLDAHASVVERVEHSSLHRADTPRPQPPPLPAAHADGAEQPLYLPERVMGNARSLSPGELARWLNAAQLNWSLTLKGALSDEIGVRLMAADEPICAENTQVLIDFFDWDDINASIDLGLLLRQQRRMQALWALQPHGQQHLRAHLTRCGIGDVEGGLRRSALLCQGMSRAQRLLAGVWPLAARRMRQLLDALDFSPGVPAHPLLHQETAEFWYRCGDHRHLSSASLQVSALRWSPVWVIAISLMLVLDTGPRQMARACAALLLCWLAWVTLVALSRWLNAMSFQHPWRLCIPPALALLSVLTIHLAEARIAGSVIAGLTLLLTAKCLWSRVSERRRLSSWRLLILLPALKGLALMMIIGEVAAAVTILLWFGVLLMINERMESITTK